MAEPDPLAGLRVDPDWDPDPAEHPELAPWRKLAAEWTPQPALDRIENKAGFVFGNVALVGTLATGLGLAAGTTIPDDVAPVAYAAGGLLALALALALAAAMPSWQSQIPTDPGALRRLYERRITVRGWLVRLSLLAYALAFAAGIVVAVLAVSAPVQPTLALRSAGTAAEPSVTGSVTAKGLDSDAEATTTLLAVAADGSEQTLATEVSRPGTSGQLAVTLTVDPAPSAPRYRLTSQVRSSSGPIWSQSLDLVG